MSIETSRKALRQVFVGEAIAHEDMKRSARAALGALPIIVSTLVEGADKQVSVRLGTHELGATDGKTIFLRDMPIPADDTDVDTFTLMLGLAYGLIHHEVGHVNDSNFDLLRETYGNATLNRVFGIIEDVRQENAHIKKWPAARKYLDGLCHAMIVGGENGPVPEDCPPIAAFTNYLMYRSYRDFRQDPSVVELVPQSEAVTRSQLPTGVFTRLDAMLPRIMSMKDSRDALNLAKDIVAMLKEEQEKAQDQSQQDQGDGQDQNQDQQNQGDGQDQNQGQQGQGDGQDQNQSQQSQGDGQDQNQGQQGQGDGQDQNQGQQGQGDGQDQNQGQQGQGDGQDQNQGQQGQGDGQASMQAKNLQDILDGKCIDQAKGDRSEVVAKALEKMQDKVEEEGACGRVEMTGEAAATPLAQLKEAKSDGDVGMQEALTLTARLRTRLQKEMEAETRTDRYVSRRGRKLAGSKLYRVPMGDTRIMRSVSEVIDVDTAVCIMADTSLSMRGNGIEVEARAVFSTSVAMEAMGVDVASATFPELGIVHRFGDRARRRAEKFGLRARGGTPLDRGVLLGRRILSTSTKNRKILVVMTDGEPDDRPKARIAIESAMDAGLEVYGLGILCDSGAGLFPNWQCIRRLHELPEALLSLLRSRLRRAA